MGKKKPTFCIEKDILKSALSKYTANVKDHLEKLFFFQRFDTTIATTEEQYHLYMLEIELVNRIYKNNFKTAEYKVALFPHCLRDFRIKCLSTSADIEQICKGCTKDCYINVGSKLLNNNNINPYISVTINQTKLFKKLKEEHKSLAALGIACIPELVRGMRMCLGFGIPAVGIPLDANRCARWMGCAYKTSFSVEELEKLIS